MAHTDHMNLYTASIISDYNGRGEVDSVWSTLDLAKEHFSHITDWQTRESGALVGTLDEASSVWIEEFTLDVPPRVSTP